MVTEHQNFGDFSVNFLLIFFVKEHHSKSVDFGVFEHPDWRKWLCGIREIIRYDIVKVLEVISRISELDDLREVDVLIPKVLHYLKFGKGPFEPLV